MQERNQDRPYREHDQERGSGGQRQYGSDDYDYDRNFDRNQSRNMSRDRGRSDFENRDYAGGYEKRDYGSGDNDRYDRTSYGQERSRYGSGGGFGRNQSGSGRRGLSPAGGYGGAAYSGSRSQDRNDRDYGNESSRGYGGGYHRGHQSWSDNARRGYDDDYDPNDRGFLDKAGDEVMSWFGDDEAARRRERDHRGKGPKNYTRSDSRIEEDVNDRLTDDLIVDASGISVSVSDGEVTLEGMVDSKSAKRRAEDCCDSVSGVTHVQNNLRVNKDTSGRWDRKDQSRADNNAKTTGRKTSA